MSCHTMKHSRTDLQGDFALDHAQSECGPSRANEPYASRTDMIRVFRMGTTTLHARRFQLKELRSVCVRKILAGKICCQTCQPWSIEWHPGPHWRCLRMTLLQPGAEFARILRRFLRHKHPKTTCSCSCLPGLIPLTNPACHARMAFKPFLQASAR